jgi:hypothetical protein
MLINYKELSQDLFIYVDSSLQRISNARMMEIDKIILNLGDFGAFA